MKVYKHSIYVPYAHIDKMGVVYYANYFVYFEMARGQLLREAGLPYGELEDRGIMLPVVEAHCEYLKPARYDDLLVILTTCSEIKGTRLKMEYEIKRGDDLVATGYTRHVCMTPDGKVVRPVPELKAIFNGHQ